MIESGYLGVENYGRARGHVEDSEEEDDEEEEVVVEEEKKENEKEAKDEREVRRRGKGEGKQGGVR